MLKHEGQWGVGENGKGWSGFWSGIGFERGDGSARWADQDVGFGHGEVVFEEEVC